MGSVDYDKAAMFTDFTLGNKPKLSAQLDTGSSTFFKDSIIESYLKYYSIKSAKIDSLGNYGNINNLKVEKVLENINVYFVDTLLNINRAIFYPNSGRKTDSVVFSKYRNHIGTLGVDLFKDKKLIIDYPNERFTVQQELLNKYKIETKIDFELDEEGRVLLPLKFQEKEYYIMFDTGASIFSLLTHNKEFWQKISDTDSKIDSLNVSSFGKLYKTYETKIKEGVSISNFSFNNKNVYLSTRPYDKKFLEGIEIVGITGNAMFLDKVIMLDFKNKLFCVLKEKE